MAMKLPLDEQAVIAGLPKPEREYRFHPNRAFRFDFAWVAEKVAVDQQGGTWNRGRHVRGVGYATDCEKAVEAQLLGWLVVLATTEQVASGQALSWVKKALALRTKETT